MFDRYVQGTKPSWKRRAVLTVSLALHGIAAIVLIVYSFIHVEEITPPALSLTFFSAPPPPPKAKNVPPHTLEQAKLSGDMPHLPDIVKIQRKGTGEATAMVKICIDQGGRVNQVSIIQGIPGADNDIMSTVRNWKYKPQPIPICSMVKFEFFIN